MLRTFQTVKLGDILLSTTHIDTEFFQRQNPVLASDRHDIELGCDPDYLTELLWHPIDTFLTHTIHFSLALGLIEARLSLLVRLLELKLLHLVLQLFYLNKCLGLALQEIRDLTWVIVTAIFHGASLVDRHLLLKLTLFLQCGIELSA